MSAADMVAEFTGTFFLTLTAACGGSALGIASALMVVVYAFGPISGGHVNPAVSLGVFVKEMLGKGQFGAPNLALYWISQLLGGLSAGLVAWAIQGEPSCPDTGASAGKMLVAEFLFTFLLVQVVLQCAVNFGPNNYFGLAIGFVVAAAASSVGDISGAVLNPAVGTGLCLPAAFDSKSIDNYWIFWIGPLLGGAVSAMHYEVLGGDKIEEASQQRYEDIGQEA